MAGPVPQKSAVESSSSSSQAPKEDLGPKMCLSALGREQILLSPGAGLVQRTGKLVDEMKEDMGV